MRFTSKQKSITWKKARRMAFWDQPDFEFNQWRLAIKDNDERVLQQSIQYMKPIHFIRLLDIDYFVEHWIVWRSRYDRHKNNTHMILLDALWGDYVMNNALVTPKNAFMSLSKKQKDTYNIVTQYAKPLSMYELAKHANRHYRRVLNDINALVEKQLFRKERSKRNNRNVDLIFAI